MQFLDLHATLYVQGELCILLFHIIEAWPTLSQLVHVVGSVKLEQNYVTGSTFFQLYSSRLSPSLRDRDKSPSGLCQPTFVPKHRTTRMMRLVKRRHFLPRPSSVQAVPTASAAEPAKYSWPDRSDPVHDHSWDKMEDDWTV